ncbi:hypothetical protein ALC57_10334 [Trachymyrmex cornetzi]|uniref:Uncharacterized protein n=1 Tax=Trachymyrmex cornetzi TaxID=471704 RepID=A0A195DWU0_9HYME|nr:hypothetical protein ALC57_10334 [Trachymyrmex cornetzi]
MRVEMISTSNWRQLLNHMAQVDISDDHQTPPTQAISNSYRVPSCWIDQDLHINHVHRQKKVISAAC